MVSGPRNRPGDASARATRIRVVLGLRRPRRKAELASSMRRPRDDIFTLYVVTGIGMAVVLVFVILSLMRVAP